MSEWLNISLGAIWKSDGGKNDSGVIEIAKIKEAIKAMPDDAEKVRFSLFKNDKGDNR